MIKFILIIYMSTLILACTPIKPVSNVKKVQKPKKVKIVKPKKKKSHKSYTYKVRGRHYTTLKTASGYNRKGSASWYGKPFHGRKTANGERYNMYAMTAAHKTLPLGTKVKVTRLANNRSVVVRINDRGPFHGSRLIDLSYAAAKKLGFVHHGTSSVRIKTVK